MERVEVFCEKINQWFIDNHNIKIDFNFNEKINVGDSEIEGRKTSSEYFINLLNENEKDRILELNKLDLEVYNFIKNKKGLS
jgi:hypothetical protein